MYSNVLYNRDEEKMTKTIVSGDETTVKAPTMKEMRTLQPLLFFIKKAK